MATTKRWRGLVALLRDGVEHGSRAVERVHKETSDITFHILEAIPPIAVPAKVVHVLHDATVSGVHLAIRTTTEVVARGVDRALEIAEQRTPPLPRDEEHAAPRLARNDVTAVVIDETPCAACVTGDESAPDGQLSGQGGPKSPEA